MNPFAPYLLTLCLVSTAATPEPPTLKTFLEAKAFSFPAEQLLRLAQSLPTHPAYEVIQLIEDDRYLSDEAGRITAVYHYAFRVDRESALTAWGQLQVSWLPWLDDRPSIQARVITPDGAEHPLDPSTLGDNQEKNESHEMFEDRRLIRGPLPMLRVGTVVEVEIRVREHRPFAASGFRRTMPLVWNVPVHESRLLVEVPASSPVKCQLYGLPESAMSRETVNGTQRIKVEQGLAQPQKKREPFQAFEEEPWPALLITSVPSWSQVVAEYRTILEPKLPSPGLRSRVKEVLGDARSRDQKVQRILTHIQKQVRYVGLEFGESAIIPRTPEETLRRGYGDCKDQSTLLLAMLREAGIEAHMALLRAGGNRDFTPEYPGLAAFNHAIVCIPGKTSLWIDPTVPQARVGQIPIADAGRNALIIAPGTKGIVKIPGFKASENCEIQTREVFLTDDGPGRVVEVTGTRGIAEVVQRIQFTGADPTRLREHLKEYVKTTYRSEALGELTLSDTLNLEQPFHLLVEAKKAAIAYTSAKDARALLNPWPMVTALNQYLQPGDPDPRDSRSDGGTKDRPVPRRTQLELPYPWSNETNWILHAPDGYGVEILPESSTRKFGPATLHTDWRRGKDRTVEVNLRFVCDQLRWTPAEVDEARAALKAFGEEPIPVIVFQNQGEAHLEAGRLKEAMAEFRGFAARHPQAPAPLVRLAQAELAAGLLEASRKTLLKAISLDPREEQPHRQLGWVLQHDAIGRRFKGDWDRAGAAAELRTSMELAPDLRMARLDLAILLGHDGHGDWWTSRDMDTVIQLYQDQLVRGKDEKAQEQLTIALGRKGSFPEARASAQLLENALDRNGWTIALDACLKGADLAIQEAKRTIQDPETRRKSLQEASDLLVSLRRYPEAGAVSRECTMGSDAAKHRARASLAPRMKLHEHLPIDLKTPVGAVLALARATADPGFDPAQAVALLSPAQRPDKRDLATVLKLMSGFHYFRTNSRDWRLQQLDELHSVVEFGIEGTERTGFRIKVPRPAAVPQDLFVGSHDGICQVVGWSGKPERLGKEALWEAERGNLEAARAWLDRALDLVVLPSSQDPLSGHPVGHVWTKGHQGGLGEIRLAAALFILDKEMHEPARKIVEAALGPASSPALRGALLRTLTLYNIPDRKAADRYSSELLSLFPDKPRAALFRAMTLKEDSRFEEALSVLRAARKLDPSDESLLTDEANTLSRMGRPGEGREILLQAVREGRDSPRVLNNLAWEDVCLGQVTEQTADWIERAVHLSKNKSHYHTQACVLAGLGRYALAQEALLASVQDEGPINYLTWFALGLIAESLNDLDSARVYFGRVDNPENPEEAGSPSTCKAVARKHLAALGKARS